MTVELSSLVKALLEASGAEEIAFDVLPPAQQLDLLIEQKGGLDREGLRAIRDARRAQIEGRGRGRPPGALNKANRAFARYFIEKYGDPASVLGEIMTTPPDLLYQQMVAAQGGESKHKKLTGADALRMIREAADTMMPYIHGKMPVQLDVNQRADVILNIPGLTDPAHLAEIIGDDGLSEADLQRLQVADGAVFTPFEEVGDDEEEEIAHGTG